MAYVNVAEWKPDQVTEWLKGLDSSILPYLQLFLNSQVNGQQLLNVRSEDLDNLGVKRLGHQELILEAVEHLRNFHYELDRENLQLLALRLSCQAHSLHNELCRHTDSQPVSTQTLADVASVVRAVKPLVCWLDRSPFSGQLEYADRKTDLLKYSLEIATCAQRDRFAERPVEEIRTSCGKLAAIADGIIQDIADPLILQPASLDLATLRKRGGDDLGFFILPSFHGVHQIGEIKFGSPAHQCGKVEEGDEVVQVNYQTVVGWQRKKVMALFEESLTDVFLTLKKRPRHTKVYGQIYMKPYRLPSKKRAPAYTRWHDSLPSPRPELLTIPDFEIPPPRSAPKTPPAKHITLEPLSSTIVSTSSESDDVGSGCDEASLDYELEGHTSPTSMRLYLPKPRVPVQRRATITGASPASHLPPVDLEKFLRELKLEKKWKFSGKTPVSHNSNPECRVLRNKSPCEQNERPSTCLGFEKSSSREYITKRVDYIVKPSKDAKENEVSSNDNEISQDVSERVNEHGKDVSTSEDNGKALSAPDSKEIKNEKRFITRLELVVDPYDDSHVEFTEVSRGNIVTKNLASMEKISKLPDSPLSEDDPVGKSRKISTESQVGDLPVHRERGRLDKSYSTPAYDLSGLEGLGMNSSMQTSPPAKVENNELSSGSEVPHQHSKMPDLTTSTAPAMQKAQNYSTYSVFKFPSPSLPHSHANVETGEQRRGNDDEDYDVNSNPVLHGRVVETINRHVLNSNCGKGDSDECTDNCDINRSNPGLSRTVTNIVLNSPDLISDITTHRFYPKPMDDFDNGNRFHLKSPKISNSDFNFDANQNSAQTKLFSKKISSPISGIDNAEQSNQENNNTSLTQATVEDVKGSTHPHASSDSSEHSPMASQHPKIPIKISVNPPEPPPRPNPPNRSPLAPSEQYKSSFRSIISSKTGGPRAVFGSPKVSRKKNPLLAKRRTVGVKELGIADYQGWLYRRVRVGDSGAQWIKGWFILKGTTFYGFKSKEANKADCFISLPGFTTSPAEEVKSRKFAFKVYHTGTVFYFAAESEEELAAWMDCLSMATFALDMSSSKTSVPEGAVFSETEDEEDDSEVADSCFPSPKMRKFTNFLSGHSNHTSHVSGTSGSPKPARSHQNLATSCESKTYDIQKKFGSLKKLGYRCKYPNQLSSQSSNSATSLTGSEQSQDLLSTPHSLDRKYLRFLSSSKSQNVPVPTAQFRSYRRVVAAENCPPFPKPPDGSSNNSGKVDGILPDTTSSPLERFLQTSSRNVNTSYGDSDTRRNNRSLSSRGEDTAGLLTLEQFMLQRQEEERLQNQLSHVSHQQDRHRERNQDRDAAESNQRETSEAYTGYTEDPVLSLHKSLEKRRTPPPAPPSPSPSTNQPTMRPIPAARTILSVPNAAGDSLPEPPAIVPRSFKPAGDMHNQSREASSAAIKQSPESLPETPRRTLIAPKQTRLKNAAMYQPPPVPFPTSPSFGSSFEMHLDHRSTAINPVDDILDNSRSKGTSSKIRQFLTPKRGHFTTSQGQFTPSHYPEAPVSSSHRTILGSPRLHRALFRQSDGHKQKNAQHNDSSDNSVHSPTAFRSALPSAASSPISSPDWAPEYGTSISPKPTMGVAMLGKKPTPIMSPVSNISSLAAMSPPLSPPQTPLSPPPDYPGLEYPPVFEPGIYSLSDTSTLLSQSSTLYSPSSDTSSSQQSQR